MVIEYVFIVAAAILFLGFIGEWVFAKTKIPDVIWLIGIGIVLGTVFEWVTPAALGQIAPFFTTFALLFLLFEAGINTDIRLFLKSAPRGLVLSFVGFALSFGVTFAIGLAIGKSVAISLLMGSILAGVSSAVVLPVIKGMELNRTTKLSLMFDSAFSDVLCILATVTLVDIITVGQRVDGFAITKEVFASFLIAIAIGVVAAIIWNNVLRKRIRHHVLVLNLAFMLFVYAVTQLFGANGAIAALVFGLILGNTKKISDFINNDKKEATQKAPQKNHVTPSIIESINKQSRDVYAELAFAIKTFFFVYLGILIDFSEPMSFAYAGIILVGVFLVRPIAVRMAFGKETTLQDANMLASLIPKGLAAAVLVQLPIQAGIPGAETLVNITLAVILLSIVVSGLLTVVVQKNPRFRGILPFLFRGYQR